MPNWIAFHVIEAPLGAVALDGMKSYFETGRHDMRRGDFDDPPSIVISLRLIR